MNILAVLISISMIAYGVYMRYEIKRWVFYPGQWSKRHTLVTFPKISFTNSNNQRKTLKVSLFSQIYEEPLKVLVNEKETRAHISNSENVYIWAGFIILFFNFISLFR